MQCSWTKHLAIRMTNLDLNPGGKSFLNSQSKAWDVETNKPRRRRLQLYEILKAGIASEGHPNIVHSSFNAEKTQLLPILLFVTDTTIDYQCVDLTIRQYGGHRPFAHQDKYSLMQKAINLLAK